jgi:hypothetical protein
MGLGQGVGKEEVMTLVILCLVILGSQCPKQTRSGKAEGEGPIMAHCPGIEQHILVTQEMG